MPRLEVRAARRISVVLLSDRLLFSVMGALMLIGPRTSDVSFSRWGILPLLLGLVTTGLGIRRLRDRQPLLIIDEQGLDYRPYEIGPIAWGDIVQVVMPLGYLGLQLRDETAYLARLPGRWQMLATANRRLGLPLLCIPGAGLALPLARIVAVASAHLSDANPSSAV